MKQACIDAVANTLGRQPKADEIKNIEDRIKDAVRVIARRNAVEGKTGIPDAETYRQAAELAAAQAVHAVFKKRQRVAQNAIAIAKVRDTLNKAIPENEQTPIALQQFIFSGAAGETSSRILTWSLQRKWRLGHTRLDAPAISRTYGSWR